MLEADMCRRGAGVADRAGLENRCGRKITEGSNPSLSALPRKELRQIWKPAEATQKGLVLRKLLR